MALYSSSDDSQRRAMWANLMKRMRGRVSSVSSTVKDLGYLPKSAGSALRETYKRATAGVEDAPGKIAGHISGIAALAAESLLSSALDYQRKHAEKFLAGAMSAAEQRMRDRLARGLETAHTLASGEAPKSLQRPAIAKRERLRAGFSTLRAQREFADMIKTLGKHGQLETPLGQSLLLTVAMEKAREARVAEERLREVQRGVKRVGKRMQSLKPHQYD